MRGQETSQTLFIEIIARSDGGRERVPLAYEDSGRKRVGTGFKLIVWSTRLLEACRDKCLEVLELARDR